MTNFWDIQAASVRRWLDEQGCRYIKDYVLRWRDLEFKLDYLVIEPIPCIVQTIVPGNTFINRWATLRLLAAQAFGRHLPAIGLMPDLEEGIGTPSYNLDFFELSVPIRNLYPLSEMLSKATPDPLTSLLLDKGLPVKDFHVSTEEEILATWGNLYSPRSLEELGDLARRESSGGLPEVITRDYSYFETPILEFLRSNLGGQYRVETISYGGRTPASIKRDVYVSPRGKRVVIRGAQVHPDDDRVDLLRLSTEPWIARATNFRVDRSILLVRTYFGPENPKANIGLPVFPGIVSFLEAAGWTVLPHNSFYDWMVLLSILERGEKSGL